MEAWLVAIGAVVALLVTLVAARRSGQTIARVRSAAGAATAADPVFAVATLRAHLELVASQLAADQHDHDSLVESLAQGVITIDPDLRIVAANTAAQGFLDRSPGALVGRSVIEAFLDAQVEAIARSALAHGSSVGEIGRTDPAHQRRLLVRGRRSASGGAWLVLEDVSELRRLQQIRTEFIDNLSHELRTPLTTVSLLAETLARESEAPGPAIPAKMRDRIGKIEVETGHLVQMVSELLDLSRIESGGTIRAVDVLDIGQLATDSTDRLRLFDRWFPAPEEAEPVSALFDEDLL